MPTKNTKGYEKLQRQFTTFDLGKFARSFSLSTGYSYLVKLRAMKTLVPTLLIIFSLTSFGFLSKLQAVVPPPDGGYAGGNTAEGYLALASLDTSTGLYNTAVGVYSLLSITDGSFCTGVGAGTLFANTANENTATGAGALLSNTTGIGNTANGAFALFSNIGGTASSDRPSGIFPGSSNTANGNRALFSNTTGAGNTANGASTLFSNIEGGQNTATGYNALFSNTTASENTANGFEALFNNTTGGANTASGKFALHSNTIGNQNTADGILALESNQGDFNTAIGGFALVANTTGSSNTAVGSGALFNNTGGVFNVALGTSAGANATTGSNNVYIGSGVRGVAGESNACYIASIFGQTSANGIPVLINSDNKLGTTTSSKRFKEEIRPMDKVSEALFSLEPVTFRYKKEIDPTGTPQLGLVAEEVEKVSPALVVHDKEQKPYSVRYDQVNAMLLNEFLKEHRRVEQLEKQVAVLTTGLQKVNAQLELSKPATQMVNNP